MTPPFGCDKIQKQVMKIFKYYEVKLPCGEFTANLECYVNNYGGLRPAMMVLPGGGYNHLATEKEGNLVAEAFLARGFNCFVLSYTVGGGAVFPQQLNEASKALEYIRDNAKDLHINPERVYCLGFSAGGHLAGCLGTMWHRVTSVKKGSNRPNGMVLCYPVITAMGDRYHGGSFRNLLGKEVLTDADRQALSIENNIDSRTCPAFLMHTADDGSVPVESTIYAAAALSREKIPFEVHIYPHGKHGAALYNILSARKTPDSEPDPDMMDEAIEKWVDHAAYFLSKLPDNS